MKDYSKKMNDPRDLKEALQNESNPFQITSHSLNKCICGHTVGFHHFNGLCKGSITEGCTCTEVRILSHEIK